jgi:hypothetical protein
MQTLRGWRCKICLLILLNSDVLHPGPGIGKPHLRTGYFGTCAIDVISLMGWNYTVSGMMMGTMIMVSLDNGVNMMNVVDFYRDIIKGLVLVSTVLTNAAAKKATARNA